MASILVRTALIYLLLSISLRIMGKRQIGELDASELVSTLLISELAAIPIDDPDIPLFNAIIPMLFILSLEIIISTLKNRSEKLKSVLDGDPIYIIYKGRLLQNVLRENRISLNELLSEIRIQGICDISDIEYGIFEQNGKLSLLKKDQPGLAHTIIIDGTIVGADLKRLGYNEEWLNKKLREFNTKLEDVFLLTVSDDGDVKVIKRSDKD